MDEPQNIDADAQQERDERESNPIADAREAAEAKFIATMSEMTAKQEKSHDVAIKFASVAIGINFFSWGVAFTLEALFGDGGWVYAVFAGLFYAISAFFFALTFVRRFKLRAILEKLFSDKV